MNTEKERALQAALDTLADVVFRGGPVDALSGLVAERLMAIGNAADEVTFDREGFRWMIERHRNEVPPKQLEVTNEFVWRCFVGSGDVAVTVENITIAIREGDDVLPVKLRATNVWEYVDGRWLLYHVHGSTPDANTFEGQAWPVEEWRRRNAELEELVAQRTAELERSLEELRAAQEQLVHQEKLASLGALTAGIAHEIKNPLNFINNFGHLSKELVAELLEVLERHPDALREAEEILEDLSTNAAKITEHGKRADSIVRGMLQHSRGGKGTRERVELNAFVEEYLNLAYHGRRAQQPDFAVAIERNLDDSAGTIELVPQDMGRVILNLLANAFDAVAERATTTDGFEPRIRVRTSRLPDMVEIVVSDNGPGIPETQLSKIFEPFFTTKPTGSGTGLGLSLSHEIVVQGHGGILRAESTPEEGTTFVIRLPAPISP